MSDVSKIKIGNGTVYDIKDARALRDAPTDGYEYVRKNGQWAISSGGGGGGDGIIFDDDTAVVQPGGSVIGNSILLQDGSAIILLSDETASGFYYIAENFSDSKSYITGELIIYDGVLYRFTADHASGAWNSSEAVMTTIKAELAPSEIGSLTNSSAFGGTIYYRRYMGVVTVWGNITTKSNLTTNSLVLGYIPEGYRPTFQTFASAAGYINYGKNVSTAPMIIENNGKITINGNGSDGLVANTQPVIFSFTYY